ncbi:tetratricopeptide repeat protein [Chitinophaga skermanii]|nr:tetratricopeptide repeat protein [Chitinophaga skermanii]
MATSFSLSAQSVQENNTQAGDQLMEAAITLMDNGNSDSAVILLDQALQLSPKNPTYTYEKAFAYYLKKDYKTALQLLQPFYKKGIATMSMFKLLGNSYDYLGEPKKALEVYEKGIEQFPGKAGYLYLEKGVVKMADNKYNEALQAFENGIRATPTHASNYYWAAKIFCNATEVPLWGLLYGEVFCNLERGSKRTEEISKLLLYTFKNRITFTDSSANVKLYSAPVNINISLPKKGELDPNALANQLKGVLDRFATGFYEPTFAVGTTPFKQINAATLYEIRLHVLNTYYEKGYDKKYNDVLFDYQRKILNAGHFEAYNYWLFSGGGDDELENWVDAHKSKWNEFIEWFKANPLKVDTDHYFSRSKYE